MPHARGAYYFLWPELPVYQADGTEVTYHPAVTVNSLPDNIFLEIFAFSSGKTFRDNFNNLSIIIEIIELSLIV